jgi:hypothetical protein
MVKLTIDLMIFHGFSSQIGYPITQPLYQPDQSPTSQLLHQPQQSPTPDMRG